MARVARLRDLVLTARRDPHVYGYRYWLHRQWDWAGSQAPQRRPQGHQLIAGRGGGQPCRCGVGHFVTDCFCGAVEHLPPLGPGCGVLPFDPDAGRHHW